MSDFHFDLVDEPWIPCLMVDGTLQELGLRGTIQWAHTIREVVDSSPLITAALHRLLLTILHRNVGPAGQSAWAALWNHRSFDTVVVGDYLACWGERFDLFGREYPFYQWPGLDLAARVPVAKLTPELASGNNATLFDHTTDKQGSSLSPAGAARYLVALQNYAVGGLVSFAKGEDPSRYKSAYAAPLVRGALTLVKGDNLFETLLLNLCRYDPRNGWPFAFEPDRDRPAWEAPPPTVIQEREPHGYLDYLTWQSRRVLLCPEQDADGAVMIRQVVIMKGNQFADGWVRKKAEVMQAFRAIEKPAAGQEPWLPVGFREDRALWRDSHAFLQSLDGKTERPAIFDWVSVLVEGGIIARARRVPVDLYGMSTDKAKVLFWRHERMILPLAYLQNKDLRNALGVALNKAEDVGKALNFATLELARLMLAPAADQAAGRQPAPEDERRLADSLAPGRVYWAHLDTAFRLLLQDLAAAAEQDPDVEPEHTLPMQTWLTTLRQSVWAAFNTLTNSLDGSARNLKASADAEGWLARRLSKELGALKQQEREQV